VLTAGAESGEIARISGSRRQESDVGVGYQGLLLALLAKRRKVDFSRTIMLGRQNHYLNTETLRALFERFGFPLSREEEREILKDDFAEGLLRKLGADTIHSLDASDYEGANIIHDLNVPIDGALTGQYTCVLDLGTLEHVFNFPIGLKNATDLLREGGWFVSATVANNFMGHGFYQLSPELFLRYLPANGFSNVEVYLVPHREFPYLFKVSDPATLCGRVELINAEPVMMHVIAVKARHVSRMVVPIQSDYYEQFWRGRDTNRRKRPPAVEPHIAAAIADLKQRIATLSTWPESLSPELVAGFENSLHYTLVDPTKV
jgi:hypothetical protein